MTNRIERMERAIRHLTTLVQQAASFAQAGIDRQRPAIEQAARDRFIEEVAEEVKAHATDCELFVFTEAMQTVREKMK